MRNVSDAIWQRIRVSGRGSGLDGGFLYRRAPSDLPRDSTFRRKRRRVAAPALFLLRSLVSPTTSTSVLNGVTFYQNSWICRYTVLASIALLKHFRPRDGVVLMLTNNICVKYGTRVHLTEASAMRYVAQNTAIPVPKVYCSFTRRGWTYIVMERIHGTYLAQGWVQRSEESKAKILSKLNSLLQQLRKLSPPGPGVSNVDGGSLYDCRLPGPSSRFGSFESVQDFHKYLRGGMHTDPNVDLEVNQLIKLQDGPWPPPSFTHGDLSSFNILDQGDEVVGIIDWETVGWLILLGIHNGVLCEPKKHLLARRN